MPAYFCTKIQAWQVSIILWHSAKHRRGLAAGLADVFKLHYGNQHSRCGNRNLCTWNEYNREILLKCSSNVLNFFSFTNINIPIGFCQTATHNLQKLFSPSRIHINFGVSWNRDKRLKQANSNQLTNKKACHFRVKRDGPVSYTCLENSVKKTQDPQKRDCAVSCCVVFWESIPYL